MGQPRVDNPDTGNIMNMSGIIWKTKNTTLSEQLQKSIGNKCQRIPKEQSKMDNPDGNKTKKNKIKTQQKMCWTPLCANKQRQHK